MGDFLAEIAACDFSPHSVRQAAEKLTANCTAHGRSRDFSITDAAQMLDKDCAALPEGAVKRILSLLLLECVLYKKESLAAAVEKILQSQKTPALHCEANAEELVLTELWTALEAAGAKDEDRAFVLESLCLSNGTAWYACDTARDYIKTADILTALNLEAIRGETGAFDDRLSSIARPYKGQIDCAANVRALLCGSEMVTEEGRTAFGYDQHPRVQDAICVRATPQTHGAVRDFLYFAYDSLLHSVANGGAYNYDVEYSLDALETALSDLANICERRTFRLNDTRLSYGLSMNLTLGDAGINHGFPVVQSNQAALLSELKLLCLPSAVVKRPGECAAYYAAAKMTRALPLLCKIMAIELLMTCQAMDIVKTKLPSRSFGKGTTAVHAKVRESISVMTKNRFVSPDMNEAARLIATGMVLCAAQSAAGALL
ncbi:MAG: aromatic amino acid lyase [Cloacibacillus sp.]